MTRPDQSERRTADRSGQSQPTSLDRQELFTLGDVVRGSGAQTTKFDGSVVARMPAETKLVHGGKGIQAEQVLHYR